MAKKEEMNILSNKNISNKIINSFNEYLRFTDGLLKEGLTFEKKVTKFSKTSAAIYLPKRLIGRTFRVLLIPLDEPYELSETIKPINSPEGIKQRDEAREYLSKKADKELKAAEKDLKKIQEEPQRKNLLDIR
jgi:putative transposon-encoded protein